MTLGQDKYNFKTKPKGGGAGGRKSAQLFVPRSHGTRISRLRNPLFGELSASLTRLRCRERAALVKGMFLVVNMMLTRHMLQLCSQIIRKWFKKNTSMPNT